jgi:hypothetical protein
MCVQPGALASALALRIERDGYVPSEADLRALLGSGCTKDELRSALERGKQQAPAAPFDRALDLLRAI